MSYHQHNAVSCRARRGSLGSALSALTLVALTACGGGGGGSATVAGGVDSVPVVSVAQPTPTAVPTPAPSAVPTAAPSPASISASPSSLAFSSAPGPSQSVTLAQAENTTGYTLSTTNCTNIVSVAATTGSGPFAFTPLGAGTCSYTVTGAGNISTTISIAVTTTSIKAH